MSDRSKRRLAVSQLFDAYYLSWHCRDRDEVYDALDEPAKYASDEENFGDYDQSSNTSTETETNLKEHKDEWYHYDGRY